MYLVINGCSQPWVINGPNLNDGFLVYINGVQQTPTTFAAQSSNKTSGSGSLVLGRMDTTTIFAGAWIDDLAFWNRKLTPDEVMKMYRSASATK